MKCTNLTDAARRAHEELFPNHVSTLKATDPELIEVFDNFAFDEVLRYGNLDTKTRLMVILASTIGSQALSEYKVRPCHEREPAAQGYQAAAGRTIHHLAGDAP